MAGLVTSQMSKDWSDYWNNSKAGDIQSWGNGFLERNADGGATYKSNSGEATNFNAGMGIDGFAKSNKEIGNILYNNYGYKPTDPVQVPTYTAPTIATQTAQAATRTVGQDELASSQLNKLLQTDSPYLQQAKSKALQMMNERGLVNSSLAESAGVNAAIDAALPIAQSDAGAYTNASRDNMTAQNNAALANMQAQNQAALAQAQMQSQGQLADIAAARAESLADKQFNQQAQLQQEQNKFTAGQQDKQNAFVAGQQDKSQAFQLAQLKQNMNLAYDKMTVDQTNTYANGYLSIVNSNMLAEDKAIALSGYSAIYGFHDGVTPATKIDLSGLPAAQSVVNDYWSSGKAGDTGAWGSGKIVNNGDGSATYTTKDGRNVALTRGMSLADLAAADSEIGANLKNLYGYGG